MTTSCSNDRTQVMQQWVQSISERYGLLTETLCVASADASFRQYFRIQAQDKKSYIVMDAPPCHEDLRPFLQVTDLMHEAHLNAPIVFEKNEKDGFLLLSDLGEKTMLQTITEENAFSYFDAATTALVAWQKASRPDVLPLYDRNVLEREINLFPEWYVGRHRQVVWTEKQQKWWHMSKEAIIKNNLSQAQVFVHRDFMLRNLMVSETMPGVIDYQDALYGPVSYDIASLMRDAFISWPENRVIDVTIRYWEKAKKAGIPVPEDFGAFYRDVEFMGVQRHLKVLGIFARINYRDHKPQYLEDTPRFIEYVRKTSQRYIELSPLMHLIEDLEGSNRTFGYTF